MKNWKEVPHLFCNSDFYLLFGEKIEVKFNAFHLGQVVSDPKNYTLIARPLSDMSDEEIAVRMNVSEPLDHGFCESVKSGLTESIKRKELTSGAFIYLLTIGVYPFDQSHFESGKVIARYENKGDE